MESGVIGVTIVGSMIPLGGVNTRRGLIVTVNVFVVD